MARRAADRVKPVEHKDISTRGGSRAWTRMVARVVREEPICQLRLDGCTIRSTTADHIIPRKYRPDLSMIRQNLRGACQGCNRRRGTRTSAQLAGLRVRRKPAAALRFFS